MTPDRNQLPLYTTLPRSSCGLIERARGHARQWSRGDVTLHTAVDALWDHADRAGLVRRLGVDVVQRVLADAFARYRWTST
jgi:hypothetical protein